MELDVDFTPCSRVIGCLVFLEMDCEIYMDELPQESIIVIPFCENPHVCEYGWTDTGVFRVIEGVNCSVDRQRMHHRGKIGEVLVVVRCALCYDRGLPCGRVYVKT